MRDVGYLAGQVADIAITMRERMCRDPYGEEDAALLEQAADALARLYALRAIKTEMLLRVSPHAEGDIAVNVGLLRRWAARVGEAIGDR